jgi:hypothetical protein
VARFATADDVATRLNTTFEGAETNQVNAFLDDVSAVIRADVPDIDDRITAGTLDTGLVRAVVFQIVARLLTAAGNGIGVASETHPEYAYTLTKAAAAGLGLTDDEISRLSVRHVGRPFSIRPGSDP